MPADKPGNRLHPSRSWLAIARGLLAANMLLWFGVGAWILAGGDTGVSRGGAWWWILLLGLLIDGLFYGWVVSGLPRRPLFFSLAGMNTFLTLSDQMGALGWAMLALVAAPAGPLLALLWQMRVAFKFPRAG